ncbi:MAG: hypothetical protein F4121_06105 [Acidimicrobiia bacterium]|nr:hypothetical protein [Acidimicrobiia bacterium]MYC45409.1 hypothetical protein [Acidimicrobiia bacterium]MYI19655.1 hypothetical protein [Acidimicrobiia bacterium]
MSQRLEVMLTSRRPDGTWTWRAAGARQPKGVLEDGLLPADAAVGDVLRVEADVSVDGIAVRQVLPTKTERPPSSPRLEHLGSKRFTEGVTMAPNLARKASDRTESPRDGRRRKGGGGRPREGGRPGRDSSGHRGGRDRPPRAPRLRPDNNHRDAWLETLSSDERAIAERLANEGIRAVRQALQSEGEPGEGQEAGRAGDAGDPRLAVVEKLFSAYRVVDWRDRAEAARKVTDEVDLRDLRSVVAGIPAKCPDDEARSLADELRGKLAARVDREHSAWIADLGSLLRKGRMVTALRVSQRPPKAGTPLPESLAGSLQEGVKSQLNTGAEDDLWVRMLEAAAQSPIRLVLVAQEVPPEPSERLLRTVRRFGERLPALRTQFGEHLDAPPKVAEPESAAEPVPEEAAEPESAAEPRPEEVAEETAEPESSEAQPLEDTTAETVEASEASEASGQPVQDADAGEELPEPGGEVEDV